VECCVGADVGARVELPDGERPFVSLFSESAGRAVVTLTRAVEQRFVELCAMHALPCRRLGVVDLLDPVLEVQGQFRIPLRELRRVWTATLPDRFEP
jgi:phosphoribosylformylglycinamidine synthase